MKQPRVFVVDDDDAVRDALVTLLDSNGIAAVGYASAEAFLESGGADAPGCLILDVRMPGMTGPQLQAELARRGRHLAIIFLTAYGDIPTTVQAIKGGAVDFLTKPVDGQQLLQLVRTSIAQLESRTRQTEITHRIAGLTEREQEILKLVLTGLTNKAIAQQLGISHRTVEVHRSHIMQKAGASNILQLVRAVEKDGHD